MLTITMRVEAVMSCHGTEQTSDGDWWRHFDNVPATLTEVLPAYWYVVDL